MTFTTIQLQTARILRDNEDLRTVDKREKVWLRVRETLPNAKFSTVERFCRLIQNKLRQHLPLNDDSRHILEENYKNYLEVNQNGIVKTRSAGLCATADIKHSRFGQDTD